jgi:hypothetical protein
MRSAKELGLGIGQLWSGPMDSNGSSSADQWLVFTSRGAA